MAGSLFDSFRGGVELKDVISCVWCKKQPLKQLIQLGCFHLACKVCLQKKLEDPSPGTPFNCPECDMLCLVPMGGIDSFPDEPLQHKMHQITMIFSNDKPNCKFCDQVGIVSSTSYICITCEVNMCENDAIRHQGMPGHTVISHEEVADEVNLSLMLKSKASICQEHNSEKNYLCIKCDKLICPECGMLDHLEHNKDSTKNIAAGCRMILEEKLEKIENTERIVTTNVQKAEGMLGEIQEMHKKSVEKVQKERKGNIKEDLLRLAKETKGKTGRIKSQIIEESQKIKQCKSAKNYMRFFFKLSPDTDVIDRFQEFLSNFENFEMTEECKGADALSVLTKDNEMSEKANESEMYKLCGWELEAKWKTSNWCDGISLCEDKILLIGIKYLEQNSQDGSKKKEFTIPVERASDIEVCDNEVYVPDKKKRVVVVLDMGCNLKRKLCLPEQEHKRSRNLGLAVDKVTKEIYLCSESTNNVYKCEKGCNNFVPWVTSGLSSPEYLCVTPDHGVVVANTMSDSVIKYNSKGDVVWTCNISGGPSLRGVCADPWGHIFVADRRNNKIHIVSDGKWLMNIDIGEKIDSPKAIIFENNRIFVATYNIFLDNTVYVIKRI